MSNGSPILILLDSCLFNNRLFDG